MRRIIVRPAVPLIGLAGMVMVGLLGCGRSDDEPPPANALPQPATTTVETDTAGEPSTPPSGPALDPCSLVSKAEAERLAGTPLDDAVPVRETCTYTGPVTGPPAQVEVFVGDGAKKFLDIERELGHELRPLAGIGDEAYASFEAVWVNRSGQWVSVRLVRLNDPAENRKPLEDLARTVATRF